MKKLLFLGIVAATMSIAFIQLNSMNVEEPIIITSELEFLRLRPLTENKEDLLINIQNYSVTGERMQLFLEAGIDPNEPVDTRRPLHFAALRGNHEVIKVLLAAHANPNVQDADGRTPLHYAQDGETVRLLIAAGANVNAKDRDGWTPLFVEWPKIKEIGAAASSGESEEEFVRKLNDLQNKIAELIARNANIQERDSEGETVLDYMKRAYNSEENELARYVIRGLQIAYVTRVSRNDIQHMVPAIIALTKKSSNLGKNVGSVIASQLIPQIVDEKLALAKQYLPDVPEDQLRKEIIASVNKVIKESPYIQTELRQIEIESPIASVKE